MMVSSRARNYAVATAVLCISTFFLTKSISSTVATAASQQEQFVPYTLEQHTISYGRGGALTVTEKRIIAIRQDGSEAWVSTFPSKPVTGQVRRLIRPTGFVTAGIEAVGAKVSRFMPAGAMSARRSKVSAMTDGCRFAYENALGTTTLLGVRASVSEYVQPSQRKQTIWRALDYGCAVLKVRHEQFVNDSWRLFIESVPVFFKGGPPNEALFDERYYEGLQELAPSEALRRVYTLLGVSETTCPGCFNPRYHVNADADYFANQQPNQ